MGHSLPFEPSPEFGRLRELLARHQSGEPTARQKLVEWVDRWQRERVSAALNGFRAVRRWYESGDVLNDLLIRTYLELAHWRPATISEFLGRVRRWVRNTLVDLWRSAYGPLGHAAHHQSSARRSDTDGSCMVLGGPTDDGSDPGGAAESAEMSLLLLEKISQLPVDQQEAVELRFWQGMTRPEVAEAMNIPLVKVNRLLSRARRRLGEELGADDALPGDDADGPAKPTDPA